MSTLRPFGWRVPGNDPPNVHQPVHGAALQAGPCAGARPAGGTSVNPMFGPATSGHL